MELKDRENGFEKEKELQRNQKTETMEFRTEKERQRKAKDRGNGLKKEKERQRKQKTEKMDLGKRKIDSGNKIQA